VKEIWLQSTCLASLLTKMSEAEKNKDEYFEIIDRAEKEKISGNYSSKTNHVWTVN